VRILYPLLFIIAISGCANTLKTTAPVPSPEQAVAIFSLSWADQIGTPPGHQHTLNGIDFSLRDKHTGNSKTFSVYRIAGLSKTADFSKMNTPGDGSVFAVGLPAGDYEFFRWRVYQGDYEIIANYSPLSVPFTLKTGEVRYFGELNLEIIREPNDYGYGVFQKGTVNLDQSASTKERDLNLIKERYPALANATIELADISYQPQSYELYGDEGIAVLRDSRVIFHGVKSRNTNSRSF